MIKNYIPLRMNCFTGLENSRLYKDENVKYLKPELGDWKLYYIKLYMHV